MDKRWIGILIIIIMAICCGYYIVSTSNTVGNAIVDVNKSTVTIPQHFSVGTHDNNGAELYERDGSAKIFIKDLGKVNTAEKLFNEKLKSLSDDGNINITKNKTKTTEKFDYYTIYYQDNSKPDDLNQSISYLKKQNHTYMVTCSKYNNLDFMEDNLNIIFTTMKLDMKKSQE